MIDDLVRRQRFAQETGQTCAHEPLKTVLLNKTGAKQDRYIRPNFAEPMKRFFAVHERHRQVEKNELVALRLPPEKIQTFETRLRCDYAIARSGQKRFDQC